MDAAPASLSRTPLNSHPRPHGRYPTLHRGRASWEIHLSVSNGASGATARPAWAAASKAAYAPVQKENPKPGIRSPWRKSHSWGSNKKPGFYRLFGILAPKMPYFIVVFKTDTIKIGVPGPNFAETLEKPGFFEGQKGPSGLLRNLGACGRFGPKMAKKHRVL